MHIYVCVYILASRVALKILLLEIGLSSLRLHIHILRARPTRIHEARRRSMPVLSRYICTSYVFMCVRVKASTRGRAREKGGAFVSVYVYTYTCDMFFLILLQLHGPIPCCTPPPPSSSRLRHKYTQS